MTENNNSTSLVMNGKQRARNYLQWQKWLSWLYYDGFFGVVKQNPRTGRYLEIGSGPGFQTVEMMRKFAPKEIVCVEPSRDMLAAAADYLTEQGYSNKVRLVNGFVEDSPLIGELGQFDLIYSTLSMHHWGDPVHGLKNLFQALSPEGVLIIFDFTKPHGGGPLTKRDFSTVLAEAGIKNVKIRNGLILRAITIARPGVPLS